jgi:hypothetical protein
MSLELSTSIDAPEAGSMDRALQTAQSAFEGAGGIQRPEPTEPEPQPETTGEPQPEIAPQESAQPQHFLEIDYQGEPMRLSREDVEDLTRQGLERLLERRQQGGQQAQQPQRQAPQLSAFPELPPELQQHLGPVMGKLQQYFDDRISAIAGVIADDRKQGTVKQTLAEVDKEIAGHDVLKAEEEEHAGMIRGLVWQYRNANEGMSVKTAAAKVAKMFEARVGKAKQSFIQGKLDRATTPALGKGGTPPAAAPKKLGRKDFANGNLVNEAERYFDRLMKAQQD